MGKQIVRSADIAFLRKMRYDWASGMGHGASGIGHGASGMGHRAYLTFLRTAIVLVLILQTDMDAIAAKIISVL